MFWSSNKALKARPKVLRSFQVTYLMSQKHKFTEIQNYTTQNEIYKVWHSNQRLIGRQQKRKIDMQ